MRKVLKQKVSTTIAELELRHYFIMAVGIGTFFFGFGAGALLNLYLLAINHPLVHQFRAALSYKSAILGDGILLPLVNMAVAAFVIRNRSYIGRKMIQGSLFSGLLITIYFHVNQAMGGIVNWAMPEPWRWNILGIWHAMYMFSVATLLSLFYLLVVKVTKEERVVPREVLAVTLGIIAFFVLLRLDYININIASLFPRI